MDLGLKGKYAFITGGTHGIGLAIAEILGQEGCHVAVCSRNPERVQETLRFLQSKGIQALGFPCDVLNPDAIQSCFKQLLDQWKTLHILVNNVGGGGRWGDPSVEKTSEEVWRDVYDKNAMAAVRFTRLALPWMREQKWGRVVTIASVHGREGGGRPWFNMAKSAEISLMKSLSLDHSLVREGITFNTVAPGCVMIPDTGWETLSKEDPEKFQKMLKETFPLGRLGTTEEVASLVAFVCSEKASYLNGACIPIDGSEGRSF